MSRNLRTLLLTTAFAVLLALPAEAQDLQADIQVLQQAMSEAEASLRRDETQIADSRYRTVLLEGWLLIGALAAAEGDAPAARHAYEKASASAVEIRRPHKALARMEVELGDGDTAIDRLRLLITRYPGDIDARRLLAQALVTVGKNNEAIQELEEAREAGPDDPEGLFTLATVYLRMGDSEAAAELFAKVAAARPIPPTHVLIGRTFRDFRDYDRARAALATALEMDPQVRRAHYYLGTIELLADGKARMADAIAAFEKELATTPDDVMAHLFLGMSLAESRRFEEALPLLSTARESMPTETDVFYFLGRSELGLGRFTDAVVSLRRALELAAAGDTADERQLAAIHYQLATALRREEGQEAAAPHFEAARKYSTELNASDRERLSIYLDDTLAEETRSETVGPPPAALALRQLAPEERAELRVNVKAALSRAYLNLGIMHAQKERFDRAAHFMAQAAEVDPDFPQIQRSLGVTHFNAGQFLEATAPLARALDKAPGDAQLKRMLALAYLNAEVYDRAARLLQDDAGRSADPSLQYAYALALVRSGRPADAQPVFEELRRAGGDSAELDVLIGQAEFESNEYDAAIAMLERAIERKSDVQEAHGTLGLIHLRRGELEEAEQALRAELAAHPEQVRSRYHLATVLELAGKSDEAKVLVRDVLRARPRYANARYLLGKILLTQGAAEDAVAELEAAAELAPEDWNVHYQLGQAYQRLGRTDEARRRFERYRELKQKDRGTP